MRGRERRIRPAEAILLGGVVLAAAYWAACSILIHRSFHSNGWDLGLIDQVIWNTAHGRSFQYSFRIISFAGDHWEPALYSLVPLKWLNTGPEALLIPLLSKESAQGSLHLHYFLVPSTLALVLAAVAIRGAVRPDGTLVVARRTLGKRLWPGAVLAIPAILFIAASPLPPSFNTDWERFDVDHHASVAEDFVRMIPGDATVSAQSPFVPHLSERVHIYEFPRVLDSEYVLLDQYGPIPEDDLAAGYESCLNALPRLGFDVVRQQDGITLWRKLRPSELVPEAPIECSGQHPG